MRRPHSDHDYVLCYRQTHLIPGTARNTGPRNDFQSRHCHAGYRTATFVVEDLLTTSSSCSRVSQSVRRYNFFNEAKPPSTKQRECPGTCIRYSIVLCLPVMTLHIKYPITNWFLFCPETHIQSTYEWLIDMLSRGYTI